MTGAEIAVLLVRFGPIALDWLSDLTTVWNTEMTPEQLKEWCLSRRKSYDQYVEEERAKRLPPT